LKDKSDCEKACWSCEDEAETSNVGCERQCAEEESYVVPQSGTVRLHCVEELVQDACHVDTLAINRCYWSSLSSEVPVSAVATQYCQDVQATLDRCGITPFWRQCPTSPTATGACTYAPSGAADYEPIGCAQEASLYTADRLSAFQSCLDKPCDELVDCLQEAGARTAPDTDAHLVPGYGYVGLNVCRDQQPPQLTTATPCQY
jgi:hypothetical protein